MREVAHELGCAPASVCRWSQAYRARGAKGLDALPQGGSPCRLSPAQRKRLLAWILEGPRKAGYENELWTLSRVQRLIEQRLGVRYHLSHVHRLLVGFGLSCQKPERVARERDDAMVEAFRRNRWPAIKKKPRSRAVRSS